MSHSRDHFTDSHPLAGRISRDYHPLLGITAGINDVLTARLRQGRTNTAQGAAHFLLRETIRRVRDGGLS